MTLLKYHITFHPSGKSIDILPGTSLLEAAWMAGIKLASSCGGNGRCLKCRVIIREGNASPLKAPEIKAFNDKDLKRGYRLACCAYALSDLQVEVTEKSLSSDVRLQLYGLGESRAVDPAIESYDIQVKAPSLEDPMADMDRVINELTRTKAGDYYADVGSARQLSYILRSNHWRVTTYIRDKEIIGFAPRGSAPLGVAIDLGTTKIAAWLMNLLTGRELAALGELNPQIQYGDDVMTRLRYAINNHGAPDRLPLKLTESVRDVIREMIIRLVEGAKESLTQVTDICIAGNTAMTHLLLDLPVSQLAAAPYVSSVNRALDVRARELDINVCPGAYIYILPGIGGFVGADHVA
ncbi:MAG: 2Fe-2S iron-sulfur cluster binding domain-containing protein, partial [Deltaproteobacteria bacterium]|nr:2Fe-2S iron-sulfur cluster binding domain-containing protein [Deltaproteobacteria bacterium]